MSWRHHIFCSLFALFRATNPSTTPGGMRQGDVMDPWVASIVTERVEGDHRFENLLEYLKATNYSFGNMPTSAEGKPCFHIDGEMNMATSSIVFSSNVLKCQIVLYPPFP